MKSWAVYRKGCTGLKGWWTAAYLRTLCDEPMVKNKLILDIRYFESDVPNVDGMSPQYVGRIFQLPVGFVMTGARIARKLREFGFTTGGAFDHLYINFSTAVPESTMAFAERNMRTLPWIRYLDFGANPKAVNKLSERKKEA